MRKKCPYFELFWSAFSRIPTEEGEILRISPYSARMRENTDQNNVESDNFYALTDRIIMFSICSRHNYVLIHQ